MKKITPTVDNGKVCQYCNKPTTLEKTGGYGGLKFYRYECKDCGAYISATFTFKSNDFVSSGRVANKELRDAKKLYFSILTELNAKRAGAIKFLSTKFKVETFNVNLIDNDTCFKALAELHKKYKLDGKA